MNKVAKTYHANIRVTFITADNGKDAAEAIAEAINTLGVLSGDEFVDDTEISVEYSNVDTVEAAEEDLDIVR